MRREHVRWLDSLGEGGWTSRDEAVRRAESESMVADTVGYVVEETDEWILLAMGSMHGGGLLHDTMQIPLVAVLSRRRI